MKKRLAILLLSVLFVGSALQAQDVAKPALRTWKDSTGQFSIQATFVRVNGDQVVLQGIDKKEISLPLAKLSTADQQYVKARLTPGSNAKKTITNTIGMTFNNIPVGTFIMGSPETEKNRKDNERQHKVTISKSFYMQTTEVTQRQWKALMGTEPWKGQSFVKEGPNYAASYVNWDDAVAYCKKLSAKEGKTYRLPTEAEWEYACRAGTQTTWSFGNDEKALGDYAWYKENTSDIDEEYAHQVGLKNPNAFGLYDMHGNVWEWCHDYFSLRMDYYKQSPEKDPKGPASGSFRGLRGGSWYLITRYSRSAYRSGNAPLSRWTYGGFRLVRELD
jgi:sulfatase modifying factor 1